jgi:hypothetical protein
MARRVKALQQNKKDGEKRQMHRDHRAKKTRNNYIKDGNPVFFKKKRGY